MDKTIVYPMIAQILLIFGVMTLLAHRRIRAVTLGEVDPKYYRLFSGSGEPDHVAVVQRNFHNQFEMPVLFFVVCLTAVLFERVDNVMLVSAWAYVALRYAHAFVHITANRVSTRFRVFVLGNAVLAFMWIWLLF